MQLQLPTTQKLRRALRDTKQEVERIADRAIWYRHDDVTLRLLEAEWRRRERCLLDTTLGTTLGTQLGTSLGLDATSLFGLFRQSFQPSESLFDASYYAADGANVVSLIDYIDPTHALTQPSSVPGLRTALPAPDAAMSNALTISFVASELYTSSRAAATWKHLHTGTGCTIVYAFVPTQTANSFLFGTCSFAALGGMLSFTNHAASAQNYGVTAGATTILSRNVTSVAPGSAVYTRYSYNDALSPALRANFYRNGTLQTTVDRSSAPSPSDPTLPFTIGDVTLGGFPSRQRFRSAFLYKRDLGAADYALVSAYLAATTGMAA